MKSPDVLLRHLLDEIDFLLDQSQSLTFEKFVGNEVIKRACTRSFEIMGEAVKNLPTDFKKKHKDIEWKDIAATRDKLIHQYFGVDWNILWDVMKEKLPGLRRKVAALLEQEKK